MFFVAIDTQYASEAKTEEEAINEAVAYFTEQLQKHARSHPIDDLQFVVEEE